MMKKFLVAIVAVSTMVLGFTSCEKKADVNVYPIAGKTYQATEDDGTVKVTFHTNFRVTFAAKPVGDQTETKNNNFVWEMSLEKVDGVRKIYIYFADGTVNTTTGEIVSGKKAYEGTYDGEVIILYPTYPVVDQSSALTYLPLLQ